MFDPDNDPTEDAVLARVYLTGYLVCDRKGVPRRKYFPEKSADGLRCRRAFARLLRSDKPLPFEIRATMAEMIDPDANPDREWGARKLVASHRPSHAPADHTANHHMMKYMWDECQDGAGAEKAVQSAMAKFNKSRDYLYRIWTANKADYEAVFVDREAP